MGEIRTIPLRSMPMGMFGVITGAPPRALMGSKGMRPIGAYRRSHTASAIGSGCDESLNGRAVLFYPLYILR